MGKANKKKQPIKPPDTSTHTINYEKMRDSMTEAMRAVRDEEREKQLKNLPTDTLTDSMRQILSGVIIFLIVVFGIGIITVVIFSIQQGKLHQDNFYFGIVITFWVTLLLSITICLLLEFIKTLKTKMHKTKWVKVFIVGFFSTTSLSAFLSLLYALLNYKLIGSLMAGSLVVIGIIIMLFMLRKGIMEEKDRSFLASYFSAMVSFMALVASITALVITIVPKNG